MVKAKIEEVRVCSVYDLWRRKPISLGFEDTDAIIVSAKTDKGERVTETFYVCLKPDGTFNANALSRRSRARRERLARFLRGYGIADAVKEGRWMLLPPRKVVSTL